LEGVTLSPELVAALTARSYPGNVRELENTVTRLVALSDGGPLGKALLDEPASPGGSSPGAEGGSFREKVERLERSLLTQALTAAQGNQSEAARQLGLSRATFLDKLKRYGLG
jgi:DNA-binding NtrC family response regulator